MRLPHLTFALILAVCATTLADDSIDSVVKASKAQICLMASKGRVRPPASTKRHFGKKKWASRRNGWHSIFLNSHCRPTKVVIRRLCPNLIPFDPGAPR